MEVQESLVAFVKICIRISHKVIILNTIIISNNVSIQHICCCSVVVIFPHFMELRSSEFLLPVPFSRQVGLPDLLKHLKPVERCFVFTSGFFFPVCSENR